MTGVPERPRPEQNPMLMRPEEAKYQMLWGGVWRPVTYMRDSNSNQVFDPRRAVAAVLWISADEWAATTVQPGDVVPRDEILSRRWDVC